jgi:penicillin amidase
MDMAHVKDFDAAVHIANHAGVPAQNLLVADSDGHIAWTIAGRIPNPFSRLCDTASPARNYMRPPPPPVPAVLKVLPFKRKELPTSSPRDEARIGGSPPSRTNLLPEAPQQCFSWGADKTSPWAYYGIPGIADPQSNRLWTANNRVTDGTDLATIGDSGYALGARAKQIRDDLFAKNQFTEKDLLAIQLDDRTLFLERWWKQLRALVASSNDPALQRIEAATRHWDAHA